MTSNVTFQDADLASPPSGQVVGTDNVGSVAYQQVKLVDGTAGNTTAIASGNGVAAGALRVTIANDSTGIVALPSGASTATLQTSGNASLTAIAASVAGTLTVAGTVAVTGVATAANQATAQTSFTSIDGKLTSVATTTLQTAGNASLASIDTKLTSPLTVKLATSTTPGQTSPALTTSTSTALALNANRVGASIFNEGPQTAYIKLGATASLTSYTVQVVAGGYYEVPARYSGIIDAITFSGTAQLRVTELV